MSDFWTGFQNGFFARPKGKYPRIDLCRSEMGRIRGNRGWLVLGMLIIEGFSQNALRLLMVAFFILFTAPVATHALSRAALKEGAEPQLHEEGEDR